jgi:hypothetical protein
MMVPMTFKGLNNLKGYTVVGLLDSGATNRFMSQWFVDEHRIEVEPLAVAVPVYNADGSFNKGGHITHIARMRLRMQDHAEIFSFVVTDTGKSDVIIGSNWLKQHNPEIDWQKQTICFSRCPAACKRARLWEEWEEEDNTDVEEGDRIFVTKMYPEDILDTQDAEHLRAMGSVATKLAAAAHEAKGAKTLEESIPAHYLEEFRGVFKKKDFNKLPER